MDSCKLPLFIKLDGKTIRVDVNTEWSILQLKQQLYLHSNKPPHSLKVIFAGSELPNSLLLKVRTFWEISGDMMKFSVTFSLVWKFSQHCEKTDI